MPVPKRKVSKMKLRTRKASHNWKAVQTQSCPACGAARLPHNACPACGIYNGRQVGAQG